MTDPRQQQQQPVPPSHAPLNPRIPTQETSSGLFPRRPGGPPIAGRSRAGPPISRQDKIIQSTDIDALSSKYSAFLKGYLEDPYLHAIVNGLKQQSRPRDNVVSSFIHKFPVINIGSYIRNYALNLIVEIMLKSIPEAQKCQIISLGAGSDTRPFNLFAQHGTEKILYHELDFAVTTAKKVVTILATPELQQLVGPSATQASSDGGLTNDEIHAPHYHLHARDLRAITPTTPLLQGMDPSLPTLVISECCLCYLQPQDSDQVLEWLSSNFRNGLGIAVYEPIGGNDSFGKVMIENLASRGISLPTLKKFPTLESQVQRLVDKNFTQNDGLAAASDIWSIYEDWIPAQEKTRISKLEVLDELEELTILLQHYCISWAVTDATSESPWVAGFSKLPHKAKN